MTITRGRTCELRDQAWFRGREKTKRGYHVNSGYDAENSNY
jgi:hypothetical protein